MRLKAVLVSSLSFALLCTGLYGQKKPKGKVTPSQANPVVARMTEDQRILHALNRLTFGAKPGDVEAVRQQGLDKWIDAQLHPETIAENPVLEAKLAPLDTLRMSTADIVQKYPDQQRIKGMVDGRLPLPTDPAARQAAQFAIERYKKKKAVDGGDDAKAAENAPPVNPKQAIAALPLSDDQKQTLVKGTPAERFAVLEALPPDQLMTVLEALPAGMRGRLAQSGPPQISRTMLMMSTPERVVVRDLMEGKLLRSVYTNRQLEEVLTDFWFNHFNVFIDKGQDRTLVTAYERDVIRANVFGKFKDLLLATAQSPAMLFYLDNWQSVGPDTNPRQGKKNARGLNENYGREIMELHTLGVDGGYTQQDVTEVARCFTGWSIRQPQQGGGFQFNARVHDNGEKHVLGVTIPAGGGMNDGLTVIDILAKHPSTARFISKSLAIRFVSDNPPETLVTKMANTFTSTGGDLREVMRTMLAASEFWDPAMYRNKLKSPLEMVASSIRAVDGDVSSALALTGLMNQLGEPLYRKIEPTGYSNRGNDWMNSASLLARMNFASALAQAKIPGVKVDPLRFAGDPKDIEHRLLLTDPSADALAAIQAGLDEQKQITPAQTGPLVAGLTLGSPDFQRR